MRTYVRIVDSNFHPRNQGDLGEVEAMRWLTGVGAEVFVPLGHSRDADLIATFDRTPIRIQVKSSSCLRGRDRFAVALCTSGGNRSWTGAVRYFDRSRCDFLFVWTTDDRRWFIPATAVDGRRSIQVGADKYSEFEIVGPNEIPQASLRCLQCPSPMRGSAVVGETGRPVKSVPRAEWVRLPPPPSSEGSRGVCGVRSMNRARATLSPGHQITIPIGPFNAAELAPGDRFEVAAEGTGIVRFERVHRAEAPGEQPELPAA